MTVKPGKRSDSQSAALTITSRKNPVNDNVYQPPKAIVDTQTKGSAVKAVTMAFIVDIAGRFIVEIIAGLIFRLVLIYQTPQEQMLLYLTYRPSLLVWTWICGFPVTLYAGYLCAKIVNYSVYKFVAVYAVLIFVLGVFSAGYVMSTAKNIILNLASLSCAFAGAWLYMRKRQRRAI